MSTRPFPRTVAALTTAALAFGLAVGAPSAFAGGTTQPCTTRTESTVFKAWGDTYSYFKMANGGFESGATDWTLSGGATVVTGNEPWKVGGSADARSLKIPNGAIAESRTICVTVREDSIRLFVKNARVPGSILHVEAIVRNPTTGQIGQTAFDVNGDAAPAGWAPTMRLGIPNLLGGTGNQELTLRFTTRGAPATWYIDDVYVDPWKLR